MVASSYSRLVFSSLACLPTGQMHFKVPYIYYYHTISSETVYRCSETIGKLVLGEADSKHFRLPLTVSVATIQRWCSVVTASDNALTKEQGYVPVCLSVQTGGLDFTLGQE